MAPKKSTVLSPKQSSTNPAIPSYSERLSAAAQKWVNNREHLKLIVEKTFDAHVIENLSLNVVFSSLGWEPLLYIYGTYYPELVHEFYANVLYKMDKNLSTIISIVKGVCIVLDREHLASILGIRDERNTITIDSNRKTIDKDRDWSYKTTYDRPEIQPRLFYRQRILHRSDFSRLLPRVLTYFFGHTLVQKGERTEWGPHFGHLHDP